MRSIHAHKRGRVRSGEDNVESRERGGTGPRPAKRANLAYGDAVVQGIGRDELVLPRERSVYAIPDFCVGRRYACYRPPVTIRRDDAGIGVSEEYEGIDRRTCSERKSIAGITRKRR